MAVTIEKVGSRLYFRGNTFAIKSDLKRLGCHWDGDAKSWWIGTAKRAEADALLASLTAPVMTATPVSAAAAETLGLSPDTPAGIVADRLRDDGRDAEADAAARPADDVSKCRVYAAVTYKGRRMYVIAEQRDQATGQPVRCRLTTLDGAAPFWVDCSACDLVRTYQGREKWDGRRYSNRTITVYPTIGSLRDFRDEQRQGERAGVPQCAACGKRSEHLVRDLEDGLDKCRHCCDMPAD